MNLECTRDGSLLLPSQNALHSQPAHLLKSLVIQGPRITSLRHRVHAAIYVSRVTMLGNGEYKPHLVDESKVLTDHLQKVRVWAESAWLFMLSRVAEWRADESDFRSRLNLT